MKPLLAILLTFPALAFAKGEPSDREKGERLFSLKIRGILESKCFGCHGEEGKKIKGDLNLTSREGLLKGGESELPALVPGKPDESPLYFGIIWKDEDHEMPPKENDRLSEKQITQVKRWISLGAPWPDKKLQQKHVLAERSKERTEEGAIVKTSGGLDDDWTYRRYKDEDVWAFRPVVKHEPPAGNASHPIDAFLAAKLKETGFSSAPQAKPLVLVRRIYFDLTGLPPKPYEIDQFLKAWKADSKKAWSDLVDRLLDSPRYGERWGQHWLDVARYADTCGYSNDYERSNAWRFRDYVIRSINDDKPYDRFILEQIAGDELDPDDPEMQVAVGFLRMGPWEHTAMSPEKFTRQLYIDDVVNNVGQTFLSTALRCCKCHDHKFDPIPTRDYYRMYAAFATTQPAEIDVPHLDRENLSGFKDDKKRVQALLDYAVKEKERILQKQEDAARKWYEERGKKYISLKDRRNLPDEEKPPRHVGLDHADEGTLKVREQDEKIWTRRLERFLPMAQSVYSGGDLYQHSRKLRQPRWKQEIDQGKVMPKSHLYAGGSVFAPAEEVTPGVLSVLALPTATGSDDDPYGLPSGMSGRRLALAKWIANADNPLTARSIVNRAWHYHFGKGIAGNPNNFGGTGRRPTHPELLDWLASWFVDNGWSMKKLHRLITTSEAYRQASEHPEMDALQEKDPNNEWIAYFTPRRLTAEELRDSLLAVSGELNLKMGGLPARPDINLEVALQPRMIQSSLAPAYQSSPTPQERNRRSIYAYRVRGQADPFMEVFNRPSSNDSCEMRDASSVSPQAFTLQNSAVMIDRSIAFALRLEKERPTLDSRLLRAFRLAFGRTPKGDESLKLKAHLEEMIAYHSKVKPEPKRLPTKVNRSLVEEFTGQAFEYVEWLNVYEKEYQADPKAWDAKPETRALADICLTLFNAHEFAFVY